MCTIPSLLYLTEHFTEIQDNLEALPGETVALATELPEPGLEVMWYKDNVPLSLTDGQNETTNKDWSYQDAIADATMEEDVANQVEGLGVESSLQLSARGGSHIKTGKSAFCLVQEVCLVLVSLKTETSPALIYMYMHVQPHLQSNSQRNKRMLKLLLVKP